MKRRLLMAICLSLAASSAQANPIVADISTYRIAIDAGFTGIRMFIFGARNESGDVVVVIRGPESDFVVRKKVEVGGIWVNRDRLTFSGVPNFYAIAASKPLNTLQANALLDKLGIGDSALLAPPASNHDRTVFPEFSSAFLAYQNAHHLYNESLPLGFMGETLFKTVIPFPDNIPKGDYTAEVYLISDGELAGMQTMPIRVEKTGFDAAVYDLAHQYALLYGMCAIALALLAGWTAGKLFGSN